MYLLFPQNITGEKPVCGKTIRDVKCNLHVSEPVGKMLLFADSLFHAVKHACFFLSEEYTHISYYEGHLQSFRFAQFRFTIDQDT